ncbi:PilN domain-containing protein [Nitrospirillum pindoramense]|uniref:Fimbrial assembly protein PilN n=1 Tax=Nitrospirillum amazonense TaxID=28077 RepID=A0A560H3Z6_9PROT|nr:PilN domain-containing protein [Nitrospirillum amazonense]TWB41022.1 fimbrial assembly protein PilN [Nitrospirillum amazonense]
MRRQTLDFTPPSYARLMALTPLAYKALAMAGLVLGLVAAVVARGRLERLADLDEAVAGAEHALAARRAPRAPVEEMPVPEAQAAAVNAAIRQLNLPWRDLLDAVEAGTPPSLSLLALEPDAKRGTLRIEGAGADDAAMLAYVTQLKKQPFLAGAYLVKHSTDQTAESRQPLHFQIEAGWPQAEMPKGGTP